MLLFSVGRFFLREMDQRFETGGTIDYEDSYLEFMFCHGKVLRLYAIIQHATGSDRSKFSEICGYCYMIGQELSSCLLSHMSGLLFCFCVKAKGRTSLLFFPISNLSNFEAVCHEFLSWQVKILINIWEFSSMRKLKVTQFFLQKFTNPQRKLILYTRLLRNCVERWVFGLYRASEQSFQSLEC